MHEEEVRRSGQKEPARTTPPVDRTLDGTEEVRFALDFVEGERLRSAEKDFWIPARGLPPGPFHGKEWDRPRSCRTGGASR